MFYVIRNEQNKYFEITEYHGNYVFVSNNPLYAQRYIDLKVANKEVKRLNKDFRTCNEKLCVCRADINISKV